VQWDSIPPNTLTQLERVCPWWIEPLESPKIKGFPTLPLSNEGKFFYIHFSNLRCFDIKFLAFPNIYIYVHYKYWNSWILLLSAIGSSSTPENHIVDIKMQGQKHYNTGNAEKSLFIVAFFILLCCFTFVIFAFRPLL
jgi:hypothetical protein